MVIGLISGATPTLSRATRAPVIVVLCNVTSPGNYTAALSDPYYVVSVTVNGWGNSADMTTISNALASYPNRTGVILVGQQSGAVAAMNWALRHSDEVQHIRLIAPYIDIVERHDRVSADATAIESAYGGAGSTLVLTGSAGSYASTPDTAALDITGDIDIRIELAANDWTISQQSLVSKYLTTGNQRSYRLALSSTGFLIMTTTANGTTQIVATSTSAISTTDGEFVAIRATRDVDNGASGNTTTFYTSTSIGGTWTQLGSAVTNAGITSIFNGTGVLEVGAVNTGALERFSGKIRAFELRSGIDGTVVADPDFGAESPGTTSFSDSTGKTWTINGTASISAGYLDSMPTWNPAYMHRKEMTVTLLSDPERIVIWRDEADTDTPTSVTDALAEKYRATLHKHLPTVSEVIPDAQEFIQKPAYTQMKRWHDYCRISANNQGYKGGDGGGTVVLPDGRWLTFFGDTIIGIIDTDDTYGSTVFARNSMVLSTAGVPTSQHYGTGTPLVPDQVSFPSHWYWPTGTCMDNGKIYTALLLMTPDDFIGTTVDTHIGRIDPVTFAIESVTFAGEPALNINTFLPDPDSDYVYVPRDSPKGIARVPKGQIDTMSLWEFWDGAAWQPDRTLNDPCRDISGNIITHGVYGDFWSMRSYRGGWIAAWIGVYKSHIHTYWAVNPTGPWHWFMAFPIPEAGLEVTRYSGPAIAYAPLFHPELDTAPDKIMLGYSVQALGMTTPFNQTDFQSNCLHFRILPIPNLPI